jgi:uncharacterized membrane protein YkvA (DUF1232 family)
MGRKYPLPKVPEHAAPVFRKLCQPLSVEEFTEFVESIRAHLEELNGFAASKRPPPYAVGLAKAVTALIERYADLPRSKQALAVGAVRYVVVEDDPLPDQMLRVGLRDDAQIVNHVLEECGIEDLFIPL